jgi:alkaline phosphatase D
MKQPGLNRWVAIGVAAVVWAAMSVCILRGQAVSHGPIVGGVSPNGARFYVRTFVARPVVVELATDSAFSSGVLTFTDSTRASQDSSVIVDLTGLQPYTEYFYRVRVNGQVDARRGRFRTFPTPGARNHYIWTTGSCQESNNNKAFDALAAQGSELFIHTGDYTYPDYQIPGDYRADWKLIELSYRRRYEVPRMEAFLRGTVIDYMVDNHDGPGNAPGGYIAGTRAVEDSTGRLINLIERTEGVSQEQFDNCLRGYRTFFPTWPLVDSTRGLYHRYTYGNIDFFFADTRNCGTQLHTDLDSAFRYIPADNRWVFDPTPGYTMLGRAQLDWLKNGLKNSTADWKIIGSGVMFNRAFRKIINVSLALQGLKLTFTTEGITESGSGFRLAYSMAYNWAGFPKEQDELINFCRENKIDDILILSGHVHTNVMDDGRNAGLPEMNCGPLASYGPEFTYYLDSVMQVLGFGRAVDSLWNGGGQGIDNKNFKNGFGRVDVYGNDSMVCTLIDEDNQVVSRMRRLHSSKRPTNRQPEPLVGPEPVVGLTVSPNPARQTVSLTLPEGRRGIRWFWLDVQGRLHHLTPTVVSPREVRFDLHGLPAGPYLVVCDYGPDVTTARVLVE